MNCMNWRVRRRMRNAEGAASTGARTSRSCAALLLAIACALSLDRHAQAAAPRYTFAVVANTLQSPADEVPTQRLLEAIGRERQMSFIVYDGNLKGAKEACEDALYQQRQALLEASRAPLVLVPGQHDWVDCGTAQAGGYDPVERLDFLRQTVFADASSMGQNPLSLTRESEVSRFHPYHENVRWQTGDTVFLGLNVPGSNNRYLSAGGRNAEFEDRVIANAFWLEHAAEYAKRRDARAIVVFIQGDPEPKRYERPDRFAWLRFARGRPRDGYLEFKRSLVKLAETFRGPVLLIHGDDERLPAGFLIDQPLRNDKGARVTNLTRIAIAPRERLTQWIRIDADLGRQPPFSVSVRNVPKHLPPPAQQAAPREEPPTPALPGEVSGLLAPAPASSLLPPAPASALPPMIQDFRGGVPGEAPAPVASGASATEGGTPAGSMQRGP
jgi:hypothetical protein